METTLFWISPERVRGSKTISRCTSCGANLFHTEGDRLEFYGTHPRSVLCMSCKEAQEASRPSLQVSAYPKNWFSWICRFDSKRPTSIAVVLLASIVLLSLLTVSVGIRSFDQGTQSSPFQGINDLALVYVPQEQGQITQHYIAPYVSHLDENGLSREWLFDSFLFLATTRDNKNNFWSRSYWSDWKWWIDKIFQKDQQIYVLNKEIERVKKVLGKVSRRGVIISIPYPSPLVDNFGMRSEDGSYLNFVPAPGRENLSIAHRLEACLWFVDEVIARWEVHSYNNLELLGFYWFQEELGEGDSELVNHLSDHLHNRNYGLYWIPYNSEENLEWLEKYQKGELNFDYVWIQPNYAFREGATERWKELRDLDRVAKTANQLNASIEIEIDKNLFLHGDMAALNNFYHYLDGGLTHLYMNKPLAYYVFPYEMYQSTNSLVRQSYDALCEFVNDRHEPVSYQIHCDVGTQAPGPSRSSLIKLESYKDWGQTEEVKGTKARLAVPGAKFSVERLDPFKDMVLAVRYLTFRPTEVKVLFGGDDEPLGRLIPDGNWHTGHWRVELTSRPRKIFEVVFTNLTWISDIWVYPDETIFHITTIDVGQGGPGLYTNSTKVEGVWNIPKGQDIVLAQTEPQMIWLVGLTYRARKPVYLYLVNGRNFQRLLLDPSDEWRTEAFTTNPHDGSSEILFQFGEEIDLLDMWVSPTKLHTNVGTAWDTNSYRHTPGASIWHGWSVPRNSLTDSPSSYRTGREGSTILLNPISSTDLLVTLEYRSKVGVIVGRLNGVSQEISKLPPAPTWGSHTITVPMTTLGPIVLSFSEELDLAAIWVEQK